MVKSLLLSLAVIAGLAINFSEADLFRHPNIYNSTVYAKYWHKLTDTVSKSKTGITAHNIVLVAKVKPSSFTAKLPGSYIIFKTDEGAAALASYGTGGAPEDLLTLAPYVKGEWIKRAWFLVELSVELGAYSFQEIALKFKNLNKDRLKGIAAFLKGFIQ